MTKPKRPRGGSYRAEARPRIQVKSLTFIENLLQLSPNHTCSKKIQWSAGKGQADWRLSARLAGYLRMGV